MREAIKERFTEDTRELHKLSTKTKQSQFSPARIRYVILFSPFFLQKKGAQRSIVQPHCSYSSNVSRERSGPWPWCLTHPWTILQDSAQTPEQFNPDKGLLKELSPVSSFGRQRHYPHRSKLGHDLHIALVTKEGACWLIYSLVQVQHQTRDLV